MDHKTDGGESKHIQIDELSGRGNIEENKRVKLPSVCDNSRRHITQTSSRLIPKQLNHNVLSEDTEISKICIRRARYGSIGDHTLVLIFFEKRTVDTLYLVVVLERKHRKHNVPQFKLNMKSEKHRLQTNIKDSKFLSRVLNVPHSQYTTEMRCERRV